MSKIRGKAAAGMPTPVSSTCSSDRKSTRLNSSHGYISYAVFCLKKNDPRFGVILHARFPDEIAVHRIDGVGVRVKVAKIDCNASAQFANTDGRAHRRFGFERPVDATRRCT